MKKFDLYSHCIKCGEGKGDKSIHHIEYYIPDEFGGQEYLKRTCRRCGYTWKERCVDNEGMD